MRPAPRSARAAARPTRPTAMAAGRAPTGLIHAPPNLRVLEQPPASAASTWRRCAIQHQHAAHAEWGAAPGEPDPSWLAAQSRGQPGAVRTLAPGSLGPEVLRPQ